MTEGDNDMIRYGVIGSIVIIVFILFPVVLEGIARIKNPTPKMNNADKRFMEIKNIKTRDMSDILMR